MRHLSICRNSAFACIQPPNEGYTPPGGGTTLNHWYHDPITGECRELKYQGYGGNANNFQTKDHCESYCKQSRFPALFLFGVLMAMRSGCTVVRGQRPR